MTEQERDLIRDAMMFAVKDMTGRVMREATVQSMIDDFKKAINYTHCCKSDSEQLQAVEDLKEFARNNCRELNVEEMEGIIDRL